MMKKRFFQEKGQGMVEFALTFPFLIVLVFAVIETAHFMFVYNALTAASREASRFGAGLGGDGKGVAHYRDCQGMKDAAKRVGSIAYINDSQIQISYDEGPGKKDLGGCPISEIHLGDRVVVQITGYYQPLVPFVNIPPMPITATSAHTILKSIFIPITP